MKSVKVTILGRDFILKSEADEQYVAQVADYVKMKLEAVQQNQAMDVISTVILAALNIADDYFQLRNERESLVSSIETRAVNLSDVIEPWLKNR
ncbi:MAG TPA: cell division protein ZapA [Thermodesulfobacteriota bacterium]|nr:cell division protein ZapA [Deltaproteobacteria bacterium]HNR12514.1 cell division protein ZapA [Thermodesulfobacteriota bacterium]HNU72876.1 cell division protein ZapA [Thermodesulfobacteriota bacterium]